ncbi:LysR family transcriptional regulator [Grimontia sp. NTOU-MAR1]|uniref:LysR family transcriptional regulator n=1 Tax=Grimontia sp. NTOU-MAR1 TaxID=3111011 RepID=UPI002DBDABA3|nr:LysR family transcriptional regulator [Grimontia sp. NTOU-MAR1]WRW00853.1 LysR family transcriptional regulator [Grimontia sp. NTOU-MAR1]
MAFTLRQLQYFVATAEQGSMSHAAQLLSISQSAITDAIKDLEADLGVLLFERHPRGLNITRNGHHFLRHAKTILGQVSDARLSLSPESSMSKGELNIGVTALVSGYVLADILSRYKRAYPYVKIAVIEDNSEYLEHLLIGGELDAAVILLDEGQDLMALDAETLDVSPYRLWLPIGHRLTTSDSISLDDISDEPLVMLNIEEIEATTHKLLSALNTRPDIVFRTRSVEAVRNMVATGAGVTLLPDMVYRPWSLDGDRIESRDISGSLPVIRIGVVWRKGSKLQPHVQGFINVAQSHHKQRSR